ncbi:MAG: tRNA uridine-5-carboxymethylaminomethyl(34) synthesis GTPase MnmE [Rhizobiaceae bacterium]|nr:tRNA uridine-5-carboxymethylaminomethyl(34) synthesis GTPase MnmE [Rhizobiaceae bacterium]
MKSADTIFAVASGAAPSGIAVVRIAGPLVRDVLAAMTGGVPSERLATLAPIRSPEGEVLDRGLVLFFAGPRSFVGEDSAELHLHGGKAVVEAVLSALGRLSGLRPAEPGEFTRRAFMNGKIDLLEAEALADLVQAETEFQRRFALSGAGAAQSQLYETWRRSLIRVRALLEAEVDFSDEDDVPDDATASAWRELRRLSADITTHLQGFATAGIIRDGFDVVIVGAPNAGKSSLLNRLAGREAAIVTDEPGTTRDLVEVFLDLAGIKVRVTDTAGLRAPEGRVEAIGIERAMQRAREADLVLVLRGADDDHGIGIDGLDDATPVLRVMSKQDLGVGRALGDELAVSALAGTGVDALLERIGVAARQAAGSAGQVLPTRRRHVDCLSEAQNWLSRALDGSRGEPELRAEELRLACNALGRLSGSVDVEDLLDVIFGEFCIGK